MSTEYRLLQRGNKCLTVGEASDRYDFSVEVECLGYDTLTFQGPDRLSLADLKLVAQRLVNVISYFDPEYNGTKPNY